MVKRQKVTDGFIEYHYAVISARKAAKVTFACQAQNNFGQIESKFIINLSMSIVRAIQVGVFSCLAEISVLFHLVQKNFGLVLGCLYRELSPNSLLYMGGLCPNYTDLYMFDGLFLCQSLDVLHWWWETLTGWCSTSLQKCRNKAPF